MDKRAVEMKAILEQRQRKYVVGICGIAALLGTHVLELFSAHIVDEWYAGFMHGFQFGLLLFLDILFIYLCARNMRIMRDEEKLITQYIKENDERTKAINQRAGKMPSLINGLIILLAGIVAGYFSPVAFLCLVCAALFIFIMTKVRVRYYIRKL